MNDAELLAKLAGKYERPRPPPCAVCGGPVTIQHKGGGLPLKWVCAVARDELSASAIGSDEARYASEHSDASAWLDYRPVGDARVMELVTRFRLLLGAVEARAQQA
jgi:hypothetical protein